MPRKAIDYQRTQIYKIVSNDLNMKELYIGSTTDFRKRKSEHKSSCCNENKKDYNYKIYQTIRTNGGWENWSMISIESYPCNNGLETRRLERYWYEKMKPTMNTSLPYISKEEKIEKSKEKVCRITCVRRTCLRIVVVVSQCFDVIIRHNGSTQWFDEIQQSARIILVMVSYGA